MRLDKKTDEEVLQACIRWANENLPDGADNIENLALLADTMGIQGDAFKTLLLIGFESGRKYQFDDTPLICQN